MCGKCCEAIHIPKSAEEIAEMAKTQIAWGKTDLDNDVVFIHFNWTPITKEEAYRINPHLAANEDHVRKEWGEHGIESYNSLHFFTCKHFDKETRKCTIHEIRPHVCSGYPWYGRPPEPTHLFYSPDCGYIEDIKELRKVVNENGN
jgi:Fe-S-cluster containining protein